MIVEKKMKLRKIHFVIHNQGAYDCSKKDILLARLQSKYQGLEGYVICQEVYTHQKDDTHLQGNLFFKGPIHHTALLKYLKGFYTPKGQESIGRVDISPVLSEGRAYNYMMNSKKDGGDPEPISDMTSIDHRKREHQFNRLLAELQCSTAILCHRKAWDTRVWDDMLYTQEDLTYVPPNYTPHMWYPKY